MKRSGNIVVGQEQQRNIVLGIMKIYWGNMAGMERIQAVKLTQLEKKSRINLDCTTCTGICGNGAQMSGGIIPATEDILHISETFSGAVLGTAIRTSAVLPTAIRTLRRFGTSTTVFGWLVWSPDPSKPIHRLLIVNFTEKFPNVIRIISSRLATPKERYDYEQSR